MEQPNFLLFFALVGLCLAVLGGLAYRMWLHRKGMDSASGISEEQAERNAYKKRELVRVRQGIEKTRRRWFDSVYPLLQRHKSLDASLLAQMEEVLLASDVGVLTTQRVLKRLQEEHAVRPLDSPEAVWSVLRSEILQILLHTDPLRGLSLDTRPTIILMVGVNGVGKTTTIGKLAVYFQERERSVTLAAADTFRAGAAEQLAVWAERAGAELIRGKEGADPSSVAFDAARKSYQKRCDVLLVDTAGRLHTQKPLMDEIKKVHKALGKGMPGAPHETLLVLDATTGQNALVQARMFQSMIPLSGVVLTKLDGTAKGGVVLSICEELLLPIYYVGLGENAEDLRPFDPYLFVDALFQE